VVQWHLACINNRWTKRALVSAGFGYPTQPTTEFRRWKPIFSVAEIGGSASAAAAAELEERRLSKAVPRSNDIEQNGTNKIDIVAAETANSDESLDVQKEINRSKAYSRDTKKKMAVVHGLNRPFFHVDLTSALQSAIANVEGGVPVKKPVE